MTDAEERLRETLYALGVQLSDVVTVLDVRIESDVVNRTGDPDVYGNVYSDVAVVGRKITLVAYTTEV